MKHARVLSWVFLVFALLVWLSMSGCAGDGGAGDVNNAPAPTAPDLVTVSGIASKGPLVPCAVRVFVLLPDGSRGLQVAGAPVSAAIMTQPPDGAWTATIAGDQPGPFTVEVRGAACSYFDEATGQQQSTGDTPILGLLPVGGTSAAITPLTHALVLVAQAVYTKLLIYGKISYIC